MENGGENALSMQRQILRRVKKLEQVFLPSMGDTIFIIFNFPEPGTPKWEDEMNRAVEQIRRGDKLIALPKDGIEALRQRGIIVPNLTELPTRSS
jgi:hypothetical protein